MAAALPPAATTWDDRDMPLTNYILLFSALLLPSLAHCGETIPTQGYTVVRSYPHDTAAFTEGLFYLDGHLYESTGELGQSSVRKVDLDTGKVLQQANTPPPFYGEGIVAWKDRLIQLTWRNQRGFVYDLATLAPRTQFSYSGEGWALTSDNRQLYMSDGTASIRRLDPQSLKQIGSIKVTARGKPLDNLNELEWVKGELLANVWLTTRIARIDPASGKVIAWIDLKALVPDPDTLTDPTNDVLNGIAYDAEHDRLFVTGKRWPKIYQIKLAQ
ncbi:glutamine cyclotransferase [Xanthomonas vasicola]|uniref:Glutaminyl-peptide cyclotransferase n=2 Tax=Xanthomonas vasicola TaxID=56459 RepID=A0ABD7SC92_XANVA|nr:glutaminyl-peptide cyclotransferase [Xanthomonas vasicola]KGR43172.2 glutamine cyclotransferase [Xanthomonas vasicola]PPV03243.1 glutamine cyclotransferase [Xanthomonas vasicola]TWQ28330.1 glutaminyl-peptide cyclotransferase [Xanthomonas vasicola]TWQ37500.1 glutaminyl-peptide cyclotransferase [Xanthomonas vasicola]